MAERRMSRTSQELPQLVLYIRGQRSHNYRDGDSHSISICVVLFMHGSLLLLLLVLLLRLALSLALLPRPSNPVCTLLNITMRHRAIIVIIMLVIICTNNDHHSLRSEGLEILSSSSFSLPPRPA